MGENLENPKGKQISMVIKQENPVFNEGCEKIDNALASIYNEMLAVYQYNPQQLSGNFSLSSQTMGEPLENLKGKEISMGIKQEDHVFEEACEEIDYEYNAKLALLPFFAFRVSDDALVVHFLKRKVCNEPLPPNSIHNINPYLHNPQQLSEMCRKTGEDEWYFFITRDQKYLNREAGNGYWVENGGDTIVYSKSRPVGFKKSLIFYKGKPGHGKKTNWIMDEYSLNTALVIQKAENIIKFEDWVACKIYKTECSVPRKIYKKIDKKNKNRNQASRKRISALRSKAFSIHYSANTKSAEPMDVAPSAKQPSYIE